MNYATWSLWPWWLMKHFRLDFREQRVALRFFGYGIPRDGIEAMLVQTVLAHPHSVDWTAAGKAEKQIIASWLPG